MKDEYFTYETRCKRCDHINEWAYPNETIDIIEFRNHMYKKLEFSSEYNCEKCDKQTVQDVVAFS